MDQDAAGSPQPPGGGELPAVRIRLDLAYDGAGFSGWAAQPDRRTVQGVLTQALGRVLRLPEPPLLTAAGRTDAGVHARGQVAHVDIPVTSWRGLDSRPQGSQAGSQPGAVQAAGSAQAVGPEEVTRLERALLRKLARALPPDVRVRAVALAPAGFDARFSALWRRYAYRVCDDPARADPLRRHDTLWYDKPLDLVAMNEAAAGLIGEHEFAAFCKKREGATTVRALRHLDWRREADGIAVATVIADAFCHHMVRSLMGAMLPVGDGSQPPSWPASVLASQARDPAVRVMPAHPLCLEEVRYPPDDALAARAQEARRVRVLAE